MAGIRLTWISPRDRAIQIGHVRDSGPVPDNDPSDAIRREIDLDYRKRRHHGALPKSGTDSCYWGFIRPSLDSWALGEFDYSGWLGNPYNWQEIVNVTSTLAGGGYMSHAIQIDTTWKGPSGDYYTIYQDAANFVEVDQYQVGLGAIYGGISPMRSLPPTYPVVAPMGLIGRHSRQGRPMAIRSLCPVTSR